MDFRILECTNRVVFEDKAIAVTGLAGEAVLYPPRIGTSFVAIAAGRLYLANPAAAHLGPGMYAAVPRLAYVPTWGCRGFIVTVKTYDGIFTLGGPVEHQGRYYRLTDVAGNVVREILV